MIAYTHSLNRLSTSFSRLSQHLSSTLRITSSCLRYQSTVTATVSKPQQDENVKPFEEMPQPDGSIFNKISYLIRNYKKITEQSHISHHEIFKSLGPTFKTSMGGQELVVTSDPKAIECMFRGEGKYPKRPEASPWLSYRRDRNLPLGVLLA